MDPERLARLFEFAIQIFDCLQKMNPSTRSRVLKVVERLSGQDGLADDVEQMIK